jgi:hypothetical protein
MCIKSPSESGQPCGFAPCAECKRLESVKDEQIQLIEQLLDMDKKQCPNCNKCIRDLRTENTKLRAENDEFATMHSKEVFRHCEQERLKEEENGRLRAALDHLGIQAQARSDPAKAPPIRVSVGLAGEAMGIVEGEGTR